MRRRDAKREACWRAASLIIDAIGNGWPSEFYDDHGPQTQAVVAGLRELIEELERRGAATPATPR